MEGISATSPTPPPEGEPLIVAAGRPIAWAIGRETTRQVVALGTGYYRWGLAPSPPEGAAFWREWTATITHWLMSAPVTERPIVHAPAQGRIPYGEAVVMRIARGVDGVVSWRVTRDEDGEQVADGIAAAGVGTRRIVFGPLDEGSYTISLAEGQRDEESSVRYAESGVGGPGQWR
jgi:hypothetical protein